MHRTRSFVFTVCQVACLIAWSVAPCRSVTAQGDATAQVNRGPRFFYVSAPKAVPVEFNTAPMLRRRMTASLDRVPLKVALAEIARQTGVRLVYSDEDMATKRLVSLKAEELTLAAALTEILLDTGLDVMFSWNGQAVLVPRGMVTAALPGAGTLVGQVTDAVAHTPIASAQVMIVGTGLSRYTDEKGQYRIPGVPAGEREIAVRRLGFEAASHKVRVGDGETATVDFAMARVATSLSEVVTTATGERSRVEVGNAIGTIKADSVVATTLIRNMSDLLQARTPGVIVTNSMGMVGAPSIIRIRGVSSVNLSNDPIIVVDGIRMTPANNVGLATRIGNGFIVPNPSFNGSNAPNAVVTTRLDDIDPNTIESIDVLRGPSASSLYGTDAAAGVIVIKTKKGVAGSIRFSVLADDGISRLANPLPFQTVAYGHDADGTPDLNCFVYIFIQRGCVQDSVRSYDPLNDPRLTTMGTGTSRNLSTSLSGGTDQIREFLSLRLSDVVGMFKLPTTESDRILRMWGSAPPSWMEHPNTEQNIAGSSRTNLQVARGLDVSLTANGIYRNTLNGEPGSLLTRSPAANSFARGYYDTLVYLPAESQRARFATVAKRGYLAAAGSYTPLPWLILHGTVGGDYTLRTDESLLRASECTAVLNPSGCPSGHQNSRGETFVTTVDLGAQATWAPRDWLSFRTSAGQQMSRTTFYSNTAGNSSQSNLAFGTDLLSPSPVTTVTGAQQYLVTENRDESATAGWYLEETMSWRERLFLTAAFRQDVASAFGNTTNAKAPTYPKYSLSWVVSDEPFFPKASWISSVRVRTAYGHSGQEARQTAVQNNFSVQTVYVDGALGAAISQSAIGNPNLRPERTAEWEGGFDLSLLENERIHVEATTYRKLSNDAITTQSLAPSTASFGYTVNLGKVENRGYELSTTVKVLDARSLAWELTVNATRNVNRLVTSNITSLPFAAFPLNVVGYPLQTVFGRSITNYQDLNGDGVLSLDEIQFGTQLVAFGSGNPEGELTYSNAFRFLNGLLQVNANFDQVNGKAVSAPRDIVFGGALVPAFFTPGSIAQQAALLQGQFGGTLYASKANTLRFAELSVSGNLPPRLASSLVRARTATVTLAARNLAVWTSSGVKDPNFNASGTDIQTFTGGYGNAGLAQPREWTLRINLGY